MNLKVRWRFWCMHLSVKQEQATEATIGARGALLALSSISAVAVAWVASIVWQRRTHPVFVAAQHWFKYVGG